MTQLLIFDLDGTLVDCKELHQAGFRWAVEQQVPGAEFNDEDVEGLPTTQKIRKLQQMGIPVTNEIDVIKREHTRAHIESFVKTDKEMIDLFNKLQPRYKLSLCSNSRSEFVFKCMNTLGLWHFESVYSRDYGPPKPDPWMYQQAMRIANVGAESTVIFEDSPVGIRGAQATGATVVEVNNSQHLKSLIAGYL